MDQLSLHLRNQCFIIVAAVANDKDSQSSCVHDPQSFSKDAGLELCYLNRTTLMMKGKEDGETAGIKKRYRFFDLEQSWTE